MGQVSGRQSTVQVVPVALSIKWNGFMAPKAASWSAVAGDVDPGRGSLAPQLPKSDFDDSTALYILAPFCKQGK